VALLAVIYTISFVGLQGAVRPAQLQANAASALVYVAQALGGSGWAKVMALGLALSVIATTGTGIVLTARIVFSMARDRVLPRRLAQISGRYATPVIASIVVGVLIVGLAWVYLLATSVQNAFDDVVDVSGILFAVFYILTALATITYYRRLATTGLANALVLGILPLAAAGFLGWIVVKSLLAAPSAQLWSLVGIVVVGIVLLVLARFVERSQFFQLSREQYQPEAETAKSGS
jgi:amino acid transporter